MSKEKRKTRNESKSTNTHTHTHTRTHTHTHKHTHTHAHAHAHANAHAHAHAHTQIRPSTHSDEAWLLDSNRARCRYVNIPWSCLVGLPWPKRCAQQPSKKHNKTETDW